MPLEDGAHQCYKGILALWLLVWSGTAWLILYMLVQTTVLRDCWSSLWMNEPSLFRHHLLRSNAGKAGILNEAMLWKKLLDGRSTFLLNWSMSSNGERGREKKNSIRCHPTEGVPSSFVLILIIMYFTTIWLYDYMIYSVCVYIYVYIDDSYDCTLLSYSCRLKNIWWLRDPAPPHKAHLHKAARKWPRCSNVILRASDSNIS